jgi:oligopeptide/dipeptide ABC transporter ATP-binding protein
MVWAIGNRVGTQGQNLLRVKELSVRYGQGPLATQAVARASLTIDAGEIVGLLGESGCGKSTLAHTIMGSLPPSARTKGSVLFREQELISASESDLQKIRGSEIALIAQDPAQALNPVLAIGVQVAEVLRSHTSLSRSGRRNRVLELLESVGFEDAVSISRRYAPQLSGGERQRAAIAQSIACRPSLLIADESTSKLDSRLKLELLELFDSLRTRYGMALLLITHDPAMVAACAQRVLVMCAGEIVESGPKIEIFRRPLHPYTQALMELARERGGTRKTIRFAVIEGEAPPAMNPDSCCFEARCSQRISQCSTQHPAVTSRAGQEVVCLKYE